MDQQQYSEEYFVALQQELWCYQIIIVGVVEPVVIVVKLDIVIGIGGAAIVIADVELQATIIITRQVIVQVK